MNAAPPSKPEILVVDPDASFRRYLRGVLGAAGYLVREAETARSCHGTVLKRKLSVIILNPVLSDMPGVKFLKTLRDWNLVPVMIVSERSDEASKVAALDAGADDFMVKPVRPGELQARLRAMLRRIQPKHTVRSLCFGEITIDLARRHVTKSGRLVALTATEYALLHVFITNRGKVLTHQRILEDIWGPAAAGRTHYLRTYVLRLRRKLESSGMGQRLIQSESGVGYRFLYGPAL